MSRKLLYIFVALSIAALVLIAANQPAKKEPVYINFYSGEVTINPQQIPIARFGWVSCSKGLQQDFIDHFVIKLELYQDSTLLQTVLTDQGKWSSIANFVNPSPELQCLHVNEIQADHWLFKDLQLKDPGVYTLWFYPDWTAPLADGFDVDQDGFLDVYSPGFIIPSSVTIHVLP